MSSFKALQVSETTEGRFETRIVERTTDELPAGEVLIRVHYSSLNFKDALSASGNRGVTRSFPHTPGIDAAGVVASSSVVEFAEGDEVIVTGYDLGMNTAGGFGQYIRVPAAWVIKRPQGLSLRDAMILGTAGLTAALCVDKLEQAGLEPGEAPVLVTGATGGVGSLAVALLRSEEHTSELQSLMRHSYADFCLKHKKTKTAEQNIYRSVKHDQKTGITTFGQFTQHQNHMTKD